MRVRQDLEPSQWPDDHRREILEKIQQLNWDVVVTLFTNPNFVKIKFLNWNMTSTELILRHFENKWELHEDCKSIAKGSAAHVLLELKKLAVMRLETAHQELKGQFNF